VNFGRHVLSAHFHEGTVKIARLKRSLFKLYVDQSVGGSIIILCFSRWRWESGVPIAQCPSMGAAIAPL